MLKVLGAFLLHRILLLGIALFAVSPELATETTTAVEGKSPLIVSLEKRWNRFVREVSYTSQARLFMPYSNRPVTEVAKSTHHPFPLLQAMVTQFTGWPPLYCMLIISNLFFLMFIWEVFIVLKQISAPEVASLSTILILFLPRSFEFSLVSAYAINCYLYWLAIHMMWINRWLFAGIILATIGIFEPSVVGLLPFSIIIFIYYQRHYVFPQILKSTVFFFAPLGVVAIWKQPHFLKLPEIFYESALFKIYTMVKGGSFSYFFSGLNWLSLFVLGVLLVGALILLSKHTNFLDKLLPLYMVIFLLCSVPFGAVSYRGATAGVALQGFTLSASRNGFYAVLLASFGMSAYFVYRMFSS